MFCRLPNNVRHCWRTNTVWLSSSLLWMSSIPAGQSTQVKLLVRVKQEDKNANNLQNLILCNKKSFFSSTAVISKLLYIGVHLLIPKYYWEHFVRPLTKYYSNQMKNCGNNLKEIIICYWIFLEHFPGWEKWLTITVIFLNDLTENFTF